MSAIGLTVSVDRIKATVAATFSVPVWTMTSQRRVPAEARPRQVAMALALQLTPLSSGVIGRLFGGRDHSTVMHARNAVARRRAEDHALDRQIRSIEQLLAPPPAEPIAEIQLSFLVGPLFDQLLERAG